MLSLFFFLNLLFAFSLSQSLEDCCDEKTVGGENYFLVGKENQDLISKFRCLNNCIYMKENDTKNRFCFKEGNLTVDCFEEKEGCVEDGDCGDDQSCSAEDTCIAKERATCVGGSKKYFNGDNVTMDCYIKQCNTESNVSWITLAQDRTCCNVDQSFVPAGWKGIISAEREVEIPLSCLNGSLNISNSFIEENVIREEPYDQKDVDSMVGWYTNHCINRKQPLSRKDLHGYLTGMDKSCLDSRPDSTRNEITLQYFFDGKSCQQIRVDLTTITTTNVYSDLDHCEMACISPCFQKLKNNRECNGKLAGKRYYFNGQTCQPFDYYGCEINRNNFKNMEECHFMCLMEYNTDIIITPVDNNIVETEYNCQEIEKQLPEIEQVMEKLDTIETVEEGLDILDNISSNYGLEKEGRQALVGAAVYLYLKNRQHKHLWWVTVSSGDCQTIEVQIRYSCVMMPWSPIAMDIFDNICNNLIPQGLITHYQTNFMYGTATYSLVVTPVRTFSSWLSKTYLIGNDPDTNNGWAHNFVYIPVFLYVNEANAINPDWIGYLAAHELGHNILFAGRTNTVIGWNWSASHKGTSTVWTQVTLPGAPVYPGPGPEIDVMYYYNGEPGVNSLSYGITFLAGEDARTLVERAGLNLLGHCGGAKCGQCWWLANLFGFGGCQPGLFCNFFGKCTECTFDGNCPAGQYCAFKKLTCKECRNQKPDGAWCLRDRECVNFCHLGRCTECQADNDCPANQYCENLHKPGFKNQCSPRQGNGAWCDRDRACINFCHLLRCTECENDNDCPANEYCENMFKPLITNECSPGKPDGAWCLRDRECANFCDGGRCAECEQHGHCPSGQYCRWRNTPGVRNRCENVCGKRCAGGGNCGQNGSPCGRCRWTRCRN